MVKPNVVGMTDEIEWIKCDKKRQSGLKNVIDNACLELSLLQLTRMYGIIENGAMERVDNSDENDA